MKPNVTIEWSDEDQVFIARVPEIGIATHGDSYIHAAQMVTEALGLHFQCLDDDIQEEWETNFLQDHYRDSYNLTEREHRVCSDLKNKASLEYIAKEMKVTWERVRQIKAKAIRKIKKQMS